jgi:hypothetical protein
MKHEITATDLNSSKDLGKSNLIFADLEAFLEYLQGQLKAPLHYYEIILQGIEAFPRLETVDRIALLKKLLFLTKQFYAISIHNLQDLLLGQLEREETILAYENKSGKTVVVNGENSNICTLSSSEMVVMDGTITEFGNYVGATAASKLNKKGSLMFHIEQDKLVSLILKTFVTIRGERLSENSLHRYISEGWNNPKLALF